jgi:hypothetical protein
LDPVYSSIFYKDDTLPYNETYMHVKVLIVHPAWLSSNRPTRLLPLLLPHSGLDQLNHVQDQACTLPAVSHYLDTPTPQHSAVRSSFYPISPFPCFLMRDRETYGAVKTSFFPLPLFVLSLFLPPFVGLDTAPPVAAVTAPSAGLAIPDFLAAPQNPRCSGIC